MKATRSARAEASVWIVRLQNNDASPAVQRGLKEWLAARPENAREFEYLSDVWETGGAISADGLPRMRTFSRPVPRYGQWAAAAVLVAAVGAGLFLWQGRWADSSYATDSGEQRVVRLSDGSRITMNSGTRLAVDYREGLRRIVLKGGEALFEVAQDSTRPFIVNAGERTIQALGTSFVVRYESARTDVTLVDGKVAVRSPGEQAGQIILAPGERVRLAADAPPRIDAPRVDAVTAWRRGEVLLDRMPLPEAVAEMNRYDDRQVMLDSPDLASVLVSGVYRTGDSPGFARAVADLHGLGLSEEDGRLVLRSR